MTDLVLATALVALCFGCVLFGIVGLFFQPSGE